MIAVGDEIGTELRTARVERRWTQKSLAFRLGISVDWLQRIELGRDNPGPELTKKIKAWIADANAGL